LSVLSGYRLVDWFRIFGFSLDHVPRFQASFPSLRTVELDARVYHPDAPVPWFQDLTKADLSVPLVPLSRWLTPGAARRFDSFRGVMSPKFRYVKIGSQDAFAFPELLPGSIVRVNSMPNAREQMPFGKSAAETLFLVEHSGGLTCSRVQRLGPKRLVLCSGHLPYAPVELELGTQATVPGVVDVEIRPLGKFEKPMVPARLGRFWTAAPLARPALERHAGECIRRARKRSGLSFREASDRTRTIARELGDSRYFCAAGALSDCETRRLPPRHIHKLISICAVYFADAAGLLEASGASLDAGGQLAMPPEFLDGFASVLSDSNSSHFLEEMEQRFEQLPYFLRNAVPSLFGLPDLSLRDVFWAGDNQNFIHPYLAGTVFLIVDRKQKTPRPSLSCPKWAQPLFVLQQRDGGYLFGFCSLENSTLILRPGVAGLPKLLRLRNHVDAEVVGKVVGIVRRLA